MKYLSSVIDGRDNHLNAIRILAAIAVLLSHSFAIVTGDPSLEPLRQSLNVTPGILAVDVFFVTSGLLLTNSLLKKQNAFEFIVSRVARIYPGLILAAVLTVIALGAGFTTLPLAAYIRNGETWTYLWKTATLIRGVGYTLPGVFHELPLSDQVNGSLWTLPIEIKMYALLFAAWLACKLFKARHRALTFRLAMLGLVVVAGAAHFYLFIHSGQEVASKTLSRFIFFFFSGTCLALFQRHIPLGPWPLFGTLAILLASTIHATAFFIAWQVLLGYLIVLLAYMKAPRLARYNQAGDYSYGVYIYAFPVQQSLIALYPSLSIAALTATSLIATLLLAACSWHFVESPSMGAKNRFIKRHTEKAALETKANASKFGSTHE